MGEPAEERKEREQEQTQSDKLLQCKHYSCTKTLHHQVLDGKVVLLS